MVCTWKDAIGMMEEKERKREGVIGNKMFLLKGFAGNRMLWIGIE